MNDEIKCEEHNEVKATLRYFKYRLTNLKYTPTFCGVCNKEIKDNEIIEELDIIDNNGTQDFPYFITHEGCLNKWLLKRQQLAVLNKL